MSAERGSWSVYLLCWRRHGGLQYIGMSQDVDRRINAHRKAGRLPFAQLGDPAVEVLHVGLDVYAACDAERREIMARRVLAPLAVDQAAARCSHEHESGGDPPAAVSTIATNTRRVTSRPVKMSLRANRLVTRPACMAGVLVSRPNRKARCGRTKL